MSYGLFTGRVIARRAETSGRTPHYHILLEGGGAQFRVAVNTRSGTSRARASDLLYFADTDFRHEITRKLASVEDGYLPLKSEPGGLALDYQRGGMFDRRHMRRIPAKLPGLDNDLVDLLEDHVARLLDDPQARLHAFGTRWGPEHHPDHVFGFSPSNGIHDVHMNQGNRDEHRDDNGTWGDGGLILHEPDANRWCALFLAFQTQSWRTNDEGDPLQFPPLPSPTGEGG